MYKPDIETKYKIACEVFEKHNDIDERYHRYTSDIPLHVARLVDYNKTFASEDELSELIKLCLEVDHNPIIGSQYFSVFSLECIQTYRAKLFRACVMLTQAVCEGLIRFVAERNQIAIKKREKALSILGCVYIIKVIAIL